MVHAHWTALDYIDAVCGVRLTSPMLYRGPLFRALNPIYAREPLSGRGAELYGGRFNPKGVPALYSSLTALTALREANQAGSLQPTTLVSYDAEIDGVFDTRDESALEAEGMDAASLADNTWRDQMKARGKDSGFRPGPDCQRLSCNVRPELCAWRYEGRSEPRALAMGRFAAFPTHAHRRRKPAVEIVDPVDERSGRALRHAALRLWAASVSPLAARSSQTRRA
jgi:hypothetical protein